MSRPKKKLLNVVSAAGFSTGCAVGESFEKGNPAKE